MSNVDQHKPLPSLPSPQLGAERVPDGIDISESEAPADVLDQMARADAINSRLRPLGYQLGFSLSHDSCKLHIELRDLAGKLMRLLTSEEAAVIAAGARIEEGATIEDDPTGGGG